MKYPFSPEILDAMPEGVAQLYRDLELKLLREITDRLKISGQLNEVTVQGIRALRAHGISLEEIEKAIRETAEISKAELDALLADVVDRNQRYYGETANLAGITLPDQIVAQSDIDAIVSQTQGELSNITRSMGFLTDGGRTKLNYADAYQSALDEAEMEIMSGGISYSEAIDQATRRLADSGIRVADYESGHWDHIDVAARRAIMTGINQLCDKYTRQSAAFLGTRYFEVSAHAGARDKGRGWQIHKDWQGGVYYESEVGESDPLGKYDDLHDTTGFGEVDGLEGANCRHHRYPFVEGVNEPTWTKEQLKHIDDGLGCTFEGRTYSAYEATQKQREIERTIRKWERREAAASTEDARTTARIRQRILREKYTEFSKAAGLPEQRERMNAYQPAKKPSPVKPARLESDIFDMARRAVKNALPRTEPLPGKVIGFSSLPRELRREFRAGLKNSAEEARTVLQREYRNVDYILGDEDHSYNDKMPTRNVIVIGKKATPSTLAHELFHWIDKFDKTSRTLENGLSEDFAMLQSKANGDIKAYLLEQHPEIFTTSSLTGSVVMSKPYRGIADILNGLSGGKILYGSSHSPEYWETPGRLAAEAWAQFGRIQYENNQDVLKVFNELFPNLSESAMIALKEMI